MSNAEASQFYCLSQIKRQNLNIDKYTKILYNIIKMTLKNPLAPPSPDELQQFAQNVNTGVVPFYKDIGATLRSTRKTVGGLVGDTIGFFMQPIEKSNSKYE